MVRYCALAWDTQSQARTALSPTLATCQPPPGVVLCGSLSVGPQGAAPSGPPHTAVPSTVLTDGGPLARWARGRSPSRHRPGEAGKRHSGPLWAW